MNLDFQAHLDEFNKKAEDKAHLEAEMADENRRVKKTQ